MSPRFSTWNKQLAAGICVLLVLSAAGFAASTIVRGFVSVTLNGVTSTGSPDTGNTTTVTGKAYKDTTTGIILQVGTGTVINAYGRFRYFTNQGVIVTDPETAATANATSDVEVITSRGCALELAVYDPSVVVVTSTP